MKILIADDDRISRMILSSILRKEGAEKIVEAENGGAAWRLLQEGIQPDLCILDIMMPELDGLELLRRMREDTRFKATPVIFCTALNERDTVLQAAALSINYYIVKPFTEILVREQVRRVMTKRNHSDSSDVTAKICARLGITSETYTEWLENLKQEVQATVGKVKTALTHKDLKTAALRINSVRGAATNLGASKIEAELSWIENTFVAFGAASLSGKDVAHDTAVFNAWKQLHGQAVQNALKRLEVETEAPAEPAKEAAPQAAATV